MENIKRKKIENTDHLSGEKVNILIYKEKNHLLKYVKLKKQPHTTSSSSNIDFL